MSTTKLIQKLGVFKTNDKFHVIGSNNAETEFRLLQVDRWESANISITCDEIVYSRAEITAKLSSIPGIKLMATKGGAADVMQSATRGFGILGFVQFLQGYYMILITKKRKVAVIAGNNIYKIEDTVMLSIPNSASKVVNPDEPRYLKSFQTVDLNSNFYFSYTYDLTNSLQHNCLFHRKASSFTMSYHSSSKQFIWNDYLLEPLNEPTVQSCWSLPIIHGYVNQSSINLYGKSVHVTIIARRSRCYAGTRFLKRGCNIEGEVANEVETEQIVNNGCTSSFHHSSYTSYIQHRGSIPVHWEQDITANVVPAKPPITLTSNNPYAQATGMHFQKMMERYGSPIHVLNLVRKREKKDRESALGREYKVAIDYLNQFLPVSHQIKYFAFDMAHLFRGTNLNVLGRLANIAESSLQCTGFFQSNPDFFSTSIAKEPRWKKLGGCHRNGYRLQTGVLRTNCVDCLDRTNSAQFVAGKCALAYQLFSLGIIEKPDLQYDTEVMRLYEDMFESHGDIIALQYGGSQLVRTVQAYRRNVAPWTSHSRDIVTTLSRYYTNTFSDFDKQAAINLFLGVYRPMDHATPLWDLLTDQYLHNSSTAILSSFSAAVSYTGWWDPKMMKHLPLPYQLDAEDVGGEGDADDSKKTADSDNNSTSFDWFDDLYRPDQLTTFTESFLMNINKTATKGVFCNSANASPFAVLVTDSSSSASSDRKNDDSSSHKHDDADSSDSNDSLSDGGGGSGISDTEYVKVETPSELKLNDSFYDGNKNHQLSPADITLEDFSPYKVYGINISTSSVDVDLYKDYVSQKNVLEKSYSNKTHRMQDRNKIQPIEIPVVDEDSMLLYHNTVNYVFSTDVQYYNNYLRKTWDL